jgi:hypothetical protein
MYGSPGHTLRPLPARSPTSVGKRKISLTSSPCLFSPNSSLRASPQALSSLREKLFLLWGDLEEIKSQSKSKSTNLPNQDQEQNEDAAPRKPKSKPFECCLKEYGIRDTAKKLKLDRANEDEGGDGDNAKSKQEENYGWERRWRLWGTTIV